MLDLALAFLFSNALFANEHFPEYVFGVPKRIVHSGACASHDEGIRLKCAVSIEMPRPIAPGFRFSALYSTLRSTP
jgi:hypothetical protein